MCPVLTSKAALIVPHLARSQQCEKTFTWRAPNRYATRTSIAELALISGPTFSMSLLPQTPSNAFPQQVFGSQHLIHRAGAESLQVESNEFESESFEHGGELEGHLGG